MGTVSVGPFRQLAATMVSEEYGNVTICTDFREGGAGNKRKVLHEMCDFFDTRQVPFVVRNLKISDYVFSIGNELAPILIERKRMEDVAASLSDGRWEERQRALRKAQFVLGGGEERNCKICYLIEGSIKGKIVHGGFVGRRKYGKTVQNVEDAIKSLPRLGLSVLKCNTTQKSLQTIAQIAKESLRQYINGEINCAHTYNDFDILLKRVGEDKGNAPTYPRHQNPDAPYIVGEDALVPRVVNDVHIVANPASPRPIAVNVGDGERRYRTQGDSVPLPESMGELIKMKVSDLEKECKARGEKISGKKNELIYRLLGKPKPDIIIRRLNQNHYVPNIPSCGAAMLVALYLHHEPGTTGIGKEKLMSLADETGISKDLMYGNPESRSPYDYNGWSAMTKLTEGDPRLAFVDKRKYALPRFPDGCAGIDVAKALYEMAHDKNLCSCGRSLDS